MQVGELGLPLFNLVLPAANFAQHSLGLLLGREPALDLCSDPRAVRGLLEERADPDHSFAELGQARERTCAHQSPLHPRRPGDVQRDAEL